MSAHGRWHRLFVNQVGDAGEWPLLDEFEDYEIEHGPDCLTETRGNIGDNNPDHQWTEYVCAVGFEAANGGVRGSLHYAGTPVKEPGVYLITAWHETYRGFDYTEYDGGLALVAAGDTTEAGT